MFQYHGWIRVQSSAGDETDAELDEAFANVGGLLSGLRDSPGLADLRWINGTAQLHIAGMTNHRGQQGQEIVELFGRVGHVAPGSYGILYFLDDEDPDGRANEFQVSVMRRGKISRERDQFLSPVNPVVEDIG